MTNLLERAISTDDADHAAKISQSAKATMWQTIAFPELGRRIVSSAPGSSVIG